MSLLRNNSIEITDGPTLQRLRETPSGTAGTTTTAGGGTTSGSMDGSMDHSISLFGNTNTTANSTTTNTRRTSRRALEADMGRSLNFLNLEQRQRRQTMQQSAAVTTTAGGASPRLALMQLRLRRLKKTSPSERLYQSDSALFSSANASPPVATKVEQHRGDVWFKSVYPKAGALEKLDEAEADQEQEPEDSTTMLGMSGTDLWLSPDAAFEANQSAPGYIQQQRHQFMANNRSLEEPQPLDGTTDGQDVDHCRR